VAVVPVMIALGAAALWFVRSPGKTPEVALSAIPLTTYPGFEGEPSFSPDGNQVAFDWNGHIYVKLIGTTGPPLQLTTAAPRDFSPAWSPDGRFIAFLRNETGENGTVLLIPALGGPERKVTKVSASNNNPLPGPYLTWSLDGNSLVISDKDSTVEQPVALFSLSIETGEKRRLTSPPGGINGDSGPAISPDGRNLAFTRAVDAGVSDLYLLPVSSGLNPLGEPSQLTFGNRNAAGPAWTPDGREIIFGNWGPGHSTTPGLWRVAVPPPMGRAAEPQRMATLGENISQPAFSRRGRRLAFAHRFIHNSIRQIAGPGSPLAAGLKQPSAVNDGKVLIASTRSDTSPQFSPDGQRIVFVSDRSGHSEIWVCRDDGSNAVQLTSFNGPDVTTPRWSPDGARIVFDSNAAGQFDIWVIGANGGKPQQLTTNPANDGNPSWSHDGRWIYFDSGRTGQQQLWKTPSNRGEPIQITEDGGWAPLESPTGHFLYYTKALGNTNLWKVPVEGGQPSKVLDGLSYYLNLAIVDSGVYFVPIPNAPGRRAIQFLSFATNHVSNIATFEKPLTSGLAVSPNGKWILYGQREQSGSELMLVENFR
jgi:Tol biopolymer transport system component